MKKNTIVQNFGEYFTISVFYNLGFAVDLVDEEGIDVVCYNDDVRYGVSVKCRNIQFSKNDSINLKHKDIIYTNEQSQIRNVEPAYAFIVQDLDRIDVLIATQEYVLTNLLNHGEDINTIQEYLNAYPDIEGPTKSVSITLSSKESWKNLKNTPGVIFTSSYKVS